jgi:aldehyde dehydrogenase (NAD+)
MTIHTEPVASLRHSDRFFIGGDWVQPSTDASIDVIDSASEEVFLSVAEAKEADMSRAVGAAREAFDNGPWPRMSHVQRASYLQAIAAGIRERAADLAQIWPRESGILFSMAQNAPAGTGTVGHNAFRTDFGIAFGGFKQSGIGREGGAEGLHPLLETKTVILEGRPTGYER